MASQAMMKIQWRRAAIPASFSSSRFTALSPPPFLPALRAGIPSPRYASQRPAVVSPAPGDRAGRPDNPRMHLTPRERERLLLAAAADLARRRLARGARLGA